MIRYNVKVNDQIYQVDLERDTTIHDAESTESSADICFEAIKAEYDYCVTRAEKLENKRNKCRVDKLNSRSSHGIF